MAHHHRGAPATTLTPTVEPGLPPVRRSEVELLVVQMSHEIRCEEAWQCLPVLASDPAA